MDGWIILVIFCLWIRHLCSQVQVNCNCSSSWLTSGFGHSHVFLTSGIMCKWGCKSLLEFTYKTIRVHAFLCVSEDFLTTESVSLMVIRLYTDCFSTWDIFDKFSRNFSISFQFSNSSTSNCSLFYFPKLYCMYSYIAFYYLLVS